jgi:hypothetical protein
MDKRAKRASYRQPHAHKYAPASQQSIKFSQFAIVKLDNLFLYCNLRWHFYAAQLEHHSLPVAPASGLLATVHDSQRRPLLQLQRVNGPDDMGRHA